MNSFSLIWQLKKVLFTIHLRQLPTPPQLEAIVTPLAIRKFIRLKSSGKLLGIDIIFTIFEDASPVTVIDDWFKVSTKVWPRYDHR